MKKNAGFTIMELMTVIAIIGILSAIAVPNMISWRANQQLGSSAREILGFINSARIQAIKGNSTVTIHFNTGVTGEEIQSVQVNRAVAGSTTSDSYGLRPGITMTDTGFGGDDIMVYNARGMLTDNVGGTVTVANSRGTQLDVVVESTGVVHIPRN